MDIVSTPDEYCQKVQELVEDEDKIVTVPFLANNLEISIQEAENALRKYVGEQRKSNPDILAVTYILTGNRKDGQGKAVYMAKESDLGIKMELFEEVLSEVLYSVQKAKNLDFNIVGLADWNDSTRIGEIPLLGTIGTKNYVKRTIVLKKLPPPPPPAFKGKSSFFAPKSETKIAEKKSQDRVNEKPIEANVDKKPKTSNGLANMFNNMTASKPGKKTDSTKPSSAGKSKGALSGFLTKSFSKSTSNGTIDSQTSKEVLKSEDSIKSEINDEDLSSIMEVDFEEVAETTKPEVKEAVIVKINKEKKKKNNKRSRDTSEDKTNKKRKRIIERNDSDSDDLFAQEDDIIEKSDEEPERIPSPVVTLPPAKSKIRKTVDKTYVDEEGFVVTNQEYVYESLSESEKENPAPPPPKVEEKPNPKPIEKKSSLSSDHDTSPQKGVKGKKGKKNNMQNQPTLMNFFAKK